MYHCTPFVKGTKTTFSKKIVTAAICCQTAKLEFAADDATNWPRHLLANTETNADEVYRKKISISVILK